MTWTGGLRQIGYAVVRIPPGAVAPGGILPRDATSYKDPLNPRDPDATCYNLLAIDAEGITAKSDLLCRADAKTGSGPENFRIRLNEITTATVSWDRDPNATQYYFTDFSEKVIPIDNAPTTEMAVHHFTGGRPTCFLILSSSGSALLGWTDIGCAIPGQAVFP